MARFDGPKIVVAQAGHINSGGLEPLREIAGISRAHGARMHVDGAFGLWARASRDRMHLGDGADLADCWSVDGHKWLQIPHDCGFAIVRDQGAHRRVMKKTAGSLNETAGDGRSPSDLIPELSRRAKGFAAWAVLRSLGRGGVEALVDRHCDAARRLAGRIGRVEGLSELNRVDLNQVVVGCYDRTAEAQKIAVLAERINAGGAAFVRTAVWNGRTILRLSVISQDTGPRHADELATAIETSWVEICGLHAPEHPATQRPSRRLVEAPVRAPFQIE